MHVALLSSSKGSLDTFGALKFAAPRMASMGILHIASNMEKHGYDQIDIYDADLMWKKDPSEILDWFIKLIRTFLELLCTQTISLHPKNFSPLLRHHIPIWLLLLVAHIAQSTTS